MDIIRNKVLELTADIAGMVFLFGSRVHGTARRSADVDLGFDEMSPETFRCVARELREFVDDSIVPWDVDMVYWPTADENFRRIAGKDIVIWKHG